MIEYISDLRLFCEISRTLNFRQAGENLGYSPAVVSMRIKRLETVTGSTLFLRSTRHIAITQEGKELLALAEKALDLTELMSSTRNDAQHSPALSGTVRITSPHSFARVFLLKPLQRLQAHHPQLTLELLLDDGITELVQEGIDISFRVGGQEQHQATSIPLLVDRRILVASSDYLARHGTPQSPTELQQHHCLSYIGLKHWHLQKEGKKERIPLQRALYCNTGDYLTQLAEQGAGVAAKSEWSVYEQLQSKSLLQVLPEYSFGEPSSIRMLIPKREVVPVRVRQVMTALQHAILRQAETIATPIIGA